MDLLAALASFVRLAETGSFSAVARDMEVTQPSVSRQVAALEAHLGARLVQRTTRSVALTEDGRDFVAAARAVLEAVDRAEKTVGRRHGGIDGRVRVSAPTIFGRVLIAPRIHLLLERHPRLTVDLVRDDGAADLVQEGVDIAIRVGELAADASYVVRRIGAFQRVIVGSAAYFAQTSEPLQPAELARHECILDDRFSHRESWTLTGAQDLIEVPVSGRFRTDSPEAAREAVLTGLGLAVLASWLIRRDLQMGTVRAVLTDWKPAPVPVHVIYPSRRHLATRTRAVMDFLLHEIRSDPEFAEVWVS